MSQPAPKPDFGKELEALTSQKGAAVVRIGGRTFVVVEVDSEPQPPPTEVYKAEDSEEAADLMDAMSDKDNPAFTTGEAMEYLQTLRRKRLNRG